jgi:hypothetical protein
MFFINFHNTHNLHGVYNNFVFIDGRCLAADSANSCEMLTR